MANVVYWDNSNLCKNNYYYALATEFVPNPPPTLPAHHTGIANSGSNGHYFAPDAPVANYNPQAPTIGVRVANYCPKCLVASATVSSATALPPVASLGHVMPNFLHTLIGLGLFANQDSQSSLHKPQSQSTTQMAIQSSQAGRMRLIHVSGIFLSPPRPLTPRMRLVPQLLGHPSQLLLRFVHHHPVSRDCLHHSQWLFHQPCLWQPTLIQARASLPPTRPGLPAWSTTCTPGCCLGHPCRRYPI
jgi:hypothetical protein